MRPPGPTFALGITTSALGPPDLAVATAQHAAYCDALRACGLDVLALPPDPDFPDATFVEDVVVVSEGMAVLCRPGADARRGEVDRVIGPWLDRFERVYRLDAGTLDGGDVCLAGGRLRVGLSDRTSRAGAEQLARFLDRPLELIDIRPLGLLHLKTGLSALHLCDVAIEGLGDGDVIRVDPEDGYAANLVQIGRYVVLPTGRPRVRDAVAARGYLPVEVDLSEFEKMDGGVSCLSVRF